MFNINNSIAVLRDAATIDASSTPNEGKLTLLRELQASVPSGYKGTPAHVSVVLSELQKIAAKYERQPTKPSPARAEKARKAPRSEKPTEVDAGRAEEGEEAPSGPTARIEEQAQDA